MSDKVRKNDPAISRAALVYSVDEGFLPLACVSIASIVENRAGEMPPVIILLHDVDKKSKLNAEQYLTGLEIDFDLFELDGSWCESWASRRGQSQAKFGILRFDEFLRQATERVLIIDADTRFVDDIKPLLELSLEGNSLAAVDDIAVIADGNVPIFGAKLGLPPGSGYFNSGLLVVDTNKWISEKIGSKTAEVMENRDEILTFNDQCALNAVLQGRYTKLEFRWNHLVGSSPMNWPVSMLHYAGHLKPWRLQAAKHVPILRRLLPSLHFDYYQRMGDELKWHAPPFSDNGIFQVLNTFRRLFVLWTTKRIRSYHRRQNSPHLKRVAVEHPELLE